MDFTRLKIRQTTLLGGDCRGVVLEENPFPCLFQLLVATPGALML